jgi:hypothetical protein
MTTQNITTEQYQEYLQQESDKIKAYEDWYSTHKIPKPTPPSESEMSFFNIAGLEASIFVLSGLGAAVLSAIRTGGLFFLMEVLVVKKYGLDPLLGFGLGVLAAIASLLTFEGSLIGVGLIKGRESGKIKVSMLVVGLSLTTVILASIFSSFTIVELTENVELGMNVVLAVVTGLASPVATYLLFENVGFIRNFVKNEREKMNSLFKSKLEDWDKGMLLSYNSSRRTVISRVGDNYIQPQGNFNEVAQKKLSKADIAYNYVSDYYKSNNALPTNKVVNINTGVSLGTSFTSIQNFVLDNVDELISAGIVTQEQVDEIRRKRGVSSVDIIEHMNTFIAENGRFPSQDEIKQAGLNVGDVARYVVSNKDYIRENNLLDDETIQKAVSYLSD